MTESEWSVSTSTSDMHALLVDRGLATEEKSRRFVEACRFIHSASWNDWTDHRSWQEAADAWCNYERGWTGSAPDPRCDLIRCIWGNPWRQHVWHEVDGRCFPCYVQLNPDWFTWRDGTIPKLARACVETACPECHGERCSRDRGSVIRCETCGPGRGRVGVSTGRISSPTLDPMRLAVLADAIEEAGCCDDGILGHLRGPGQHVRGCWAVQLFSEASPIEK